MPDLDIHTAVRTAVIVLSLFILYSVWAGIRQIRKARSIKFFRMRRERIVLGWRMLGAAVLLGVITLLVNRFAEPIAYSYFPPTTTPSITPTTTLTPTISLTPTITQSPTITPTPRESATPTITPTPRVPLAIETLFISTITPNPGAVFSPLQFARELDDDFNPVDPATVFQNPIEHLYALFSYDQMIVGSQWTALWYRGIDLVHYETAPWDGATGGIGYTDWEADPSAWLPGEYEVQIFVGFEWKVSGRFTVEGDAPTAIPSPTLSPTATPVPTRTVTRTPTRTSTHAPTLTPRPSDTRQPSQTPTRRVFPTATPSVANTHAPTFTPAPPTPTFTHAPTYTPAPPTPTFTHAPTFTPRPLSITVTPDVARSGPPGAHYVLARPGWLARWLLR